MHHCLVIISIGDTGLRGPIGQPGEPGIKELRVIKVTHEGFIHVCTRMLSSVVVGDKGDPGPKGSAQLTSRGMKGDKGNNGLPGPMGPKGEQGDTLIAIFTHQIVVKHININEDQQDILVGKENLDQED